MPTAEALDPAGQSTAPARLLRVSDIYGQALRTPEGQPTGLSEWLGVLG